MEDKYLVCFPKCGLNDMLCRMLECYEYCVKYNRTLVIDTSRDWFRDDIRDYINFNSPIIYQGDLNELYDKLNEESTFPPEFKGELKICNNFDYTAQFEYLYGNKIIDNDLSRDFSEPVKVYVAHGGGNPVDLLKMCSLKPLILDVFRERYGQLPVDYVSVHIRNTDIRSNVDEFLEKHKEELKDKAVFLGTDHAPTISKFREIFGNNLYSFATIPHNNGHNIHNHHRYIPNRQFNIDCFVDLLLLAAGSKLYLSTVVNSTHSGYGQLAMSLHNNKDLFRQLTA